MNSNRRALGRWPNAPLALVVAQVRFLPNSHIEPSLLAESIKKRVGLRFPKLASLGAYSFVVGAPPGAVATPPANAGLTGFELRDSEDTAAIRMQPDSLTFITSAYQDSDHFKAQWRELMGALCEMEDVRVMRLGMRTVDFILPSHDHEPEDYFKDGFGRSPGVLDGQSPITFQLYDYEREERGHLRIQYSRGYGMPSLPSDLQGVNPPAKLTYNISADLSAVLDMDRWQPYNTLMNAEAIVQAVENLHDDLRESFKKIMSNLADKEWREDPEKVTE